MSTFIFRKKIAAIFIAFSIYSISPFAYSQENEAEIESLQTKLNNLHTLLAEFHQTVKASNRNLSESYGVMALERPGHFRWETHKPAKQLLVADGAHLWSYDPDLEQATIKVQGKNLGGAAALFLSEYNANTLARDFKIRPFKRGNNEGYHLEARSSKESYSHLTLLFAGKILQSIEIDDQLGQHTTVTLNKVQTNIKLASTLFKFIPPKGTDIVEQ